MRISDWSSDVCSSDLPDAGVDRRARQTAQVFQRMQTDAKRQLQAAVKAGGGKAACRQRRVVEECADEADHLVHRAPVVPQDRTSVVWGTRVSVRVDFGGRRIIKKKKSRKQTKD